MSAMFEGKHWGRLKCIGVVETERTIDLGGAAMTGTETQYLLQCDCGREFEIWKNEFKGARDTRDCGCGIGYGRHTPVRQIFAYLRDPDYERLKRLSALDHRALSAWITEAILERLDRREKEELDKLTR